jgi:hypothetical protein
LPEELKEEATKCVEFFKNYIKDKNMDGIINEIIKSIKSSKIKTIDGVIKTINNNYKVIEENIAKCKKNINDSGINKNNKNELMAHLNNAAIKIENFYTIKISKLVESKFNKLIVKATKDLNDDKVSSEDLTEEEKHLKYFQSEDFQGFDETFKKLENNKNITESKN